MSGGRWATCRRTLHSHPSSRLLGRRLALGRGRAARAPVTQARCRCRLPQDVLPSGQPTDKDMKRAEVGGRFCPAGTHALMTAMSKLGPLSLAAVRSPPEAPRPALPGTTRPRSRPHVRAQDKFGSCIGECAKEALERLPCMRGDIEAQMKRL